MLGAGEVRHSTPASEGRARVEHVPGSSFTLSAALFFLDYLAHGVHDPIVTAAFPLFVDF
jgi:hypothetical protein